MVALSKGPKKKGGFSGKRETVNTPLALGKGGRGGVAGDLLLARQCRAREAKLY